MIAGQKSKLWEVWQDNSTRRYKELQHMYFELVYMYLLTTLHIFNLIFFVYLYNILLSSFLPQILQEKKL